VWPENTLGGLWGFYFWGSHSSGFLDIMPHRSPTSRWGRAGLAHPRGPGSRSTARCGGPCPPRCRRPGPGTGLAPRWARRDGRPLSPLPPTLAPPLAAKKAAGRETWVGYPPHPQAHWQPHGRRGMIELGRIRRVGPTGAGGYPRPRGGARLQHPQQTLPEGGGFLAGGVLGMPSGERPRPWYSKPLSSLLAMGT